MCGVFGLVAAICSGAVFVSRAQPVWAQEKVTQRPRTVILNREVELEFTPETGFFIAQFDSGPFVRVPAILVPAFKNSTSDHQESHSNQWLVGGVVAVPEEAIVLHSYGVVLGREKQVATLALAAQEVLTLPFNGDSEEQLRAHLMGRKSMVSSLKLQMAEQESTLRRLREDAEVVGNFARIVDAREELAKVEASIRSVEKDISNLERFLRLANTYPTPKNYRNREQQLASQLIELTEAARKAEQGEFSRRQAAQGDMEHRLQLLEASRTGDLAGLQEQLSILRAERERLERGSPTRPNSGESSSTFEPPPATADEL